MWYRDLGHRRTRVLQEEFRSTPIPRPVAEAVESDEGRGGRASEELQKAITLEKYKTWAYYD